MLLLLFGVCQLSAKNTYAQSVSLSFSMKNTTIEKVLDKIEQETEFSFLVMDKSVNLHKKVDNIQADHENINPVLDRLFKETEIAYRIIDRQIVLLPAAMAATLQDNLQQDKRIITGTVRDLAGEPVIGAIIVEKGTNNSALSDAEGTYSINISGASATLVFSMLGFQIQETLVGTRNVLDITLKENNLSLDEVVVVGYGAQKKINLTGAVSTVKASDIQSMPVSNLSNALSGRLAGVNITQSSGGRPGNSSEISIRAKGSWNDTSPLYVIDGVARDKFAFDGLDAADIESLSILKDGASSAIYGSRSANGVVLVTTKKGQQGKPVISYSGTVGMSDATKIPETQDAYHQALFINDGVITAGGNEKDMRYYTPDELEYYKTYNHDWMKEAWKNPVVTHHSLNVSGGTENVRYFIGGSYYYETGAFNRLEFNKYTLRGNVEANITRDLIASLDLNTDIRDDMKPYWVNDGRNDALYDYFGIALLYTPGMRPSYINGLPVGNDMSTNFMEMVSDDFGYNNRKYSNYEANIALRYNVSAVPGLSLKLQYNNYSRHQFTKEFCIPYNRYFFKTTGTHGHILTNELDYISERNDGNFLNERYDRGSSYQFNGFINYDRRFDKHDISAVFVFEQSEGFNDWFRAEVRKYASSVVDQLSAGSKDPNDFSVEGKGSETARQSYAGRIHYGYDDRYLLEVSMRYDGSVNFTPERRWGFFPSVSAAWRISEEKFFKDNIQFISNLKLRGSVGLLGNDLVRDANGNLLEWQWMQTYQYSGGAQYGTSATGLLPNVIPNVVITWEKSLTWNGGLDAGFLKNRLNLGFDIFKKHTYDVLGTRINVLPSTFGGAMPAENYGVVDSKGFEVELNYTDRIGKDFTWRVGGNLAYAVNKLITKDEAENLPWYRSEIGYSTDRLRGFIYTDIIRTQADLDALPAGYTINGKRPELGMINYKDVRGVTSDEPDGKITDEDQDWIINHTTPPVTYGFSLGGSWKGWALNLFLQGVAGNELLVSYRDQNARVAKKNFEGWTDHWTPTNVNARYPRAEAPNSLNYPGSTFWLKDGSYLRLKNVDLSYTFQKPVLSALGVSQLRIFFTGVNLFLLEDHVKDFDPEFGNTAANITRYPVMKSYSLGVNFSF